MANDNFVVIAPFAAALVLAVLTAVSWKNFEARWSFAILSLISLAAGVLISSAIAVGLAIAGKIPS